MSRERRSPSFVRRYHISCCQHEDTTFVHPSQLQLSLISCFFLIWTNFSTFTKVVNNNKNNIHTRRRLQLTYTPQLFADRDIYILCMILSSSTLVAIYYGILNIKNIDITKYVITQLIFLYVLNQIIKSKVFCF